jgi:hypothetical protein
MALAVWARQPGENFQGPTLVMRCAQAAYALQFYIIKTLLPVGLRPQFFLPEPFDIRDILFAVGLPTCIAIITLVVVLSRKWPTLGIAWLIYFAMLLPVLGLVRISDLLVADRYSYLSTMSLFGLLAGVLLCISPRLRSTAFTMVSITIIVFILLSWTQCAVWHDWQTLTAAGRA